MIEAINNTVMVPGCLLGYAVLCYSAVSGLGMVYDKIVHGEPILWEPN